MVTAVCFTVADWLLEGDEVMVHNLVGAASSGVQWNCALVDDCLFSGSVFDRIDVGCANGVAARVTVTDRLIDGMDPLLLHGRQGFAECVFGMVSLLGLESC